MSGSELHALRRKIASIEGRPAWQEDSESARSRPGSMPQTGSAPRHEPDLETEPDLGKSAFRGHGRPRTADGWTSARPTDQETQAAGDGNRLPFRIDALDRTLGGGLPVAAFHEIGCRETRDMGALNGFVAALLTRLLATRGKPVLWIEEEMALTEAGFPFGAGLVRFGLNPKNLILVRVRRPEDALWALEEGLRCPGLTAAMAVIRAAPQALDFTASRRLAIRAGAHGVMGVLMRQAGTASATAATTRWWIAPRPSGVMDAFGDGVGRPAWNATLDRSRIGPVGNFDLEWDHGHGRFLTPAAADPVAVPALPFDRQDHAHDARAGLALRKAG